MYMFIHIIHYNPHLECPISISLILAPNFIQASVDTKQQQMIYLNSKLLLKYNFLSAIEVSLF